MKILNIGIVGGGSFGTALGTAAARSGHNVLLHSRNEVVRDEINNNHTHSKFFPNDIKLPNNLNSTCNLDEVVSNSDIIIHAIPVQASYEFLLSIADKLKENTPYIIASKGILLK
jgi:glycerol-3-phosphate dehydrogenase (NAD(P)+)